MKNKQKGSGLLEVMIGLFVLAVGLLGMANMQNKALRLNSNAYLYSQAVFLASDITERIRANKKEVLTYKTLFSEAPVSAVDCSSGICSASQMAAWDLDTWKADVTELLPQGKAEITVAGIDNNELTVTVRFDDTRGSDVSNPISVVVSTQI